MINGVILKILVNSGAIGVALATIFGAYKVMTNDLSHLEGAVRETSNIQATIQQQTNEILRQNTKAIEGNTEVIRSLKDFILRK